MDQKAMEHAEPIFQQEQVSAIIPRPIHQAATKQLISAMVPKTVLCVVVRPENFKSIGYDFIEFLAVIRGGDQQNLVFYLDKLPGNVSTALQGYYQQHPTNMQAIAVEDPLDFLALAQKTGPGAGIKKSNIDPTRGFASLYNLCAELGMSMYGASSAAYPWSSLVACRIKNAVERIPKQIEAVECGANSAARALILCHVDQNIYTSEGRYWEEGGYYFFELGCPKDSDSIGKKRMKPIGFGLAFLGILMAPFTIGLGFGLYGAGVALSFGGAILETGPSPWNLSNYIDRHIPRGCAFKFSKVYSYVHFSNCAKAIASDITDSDPVIVFIFWEPTAWHYANVVGFKGDHKRAEGFILLETNKDFDYRTYDNMEHVMYNQYKFNSSFCLGGTPKNYTIIRFHRR